jgi:CHAT domain-containing protein
VFADPQPQCDPLPSAGEEAEHVRRAFREAIVFPGTKATVEELHRQAAVCGVLHLACHAQFDEEQPLRSSLH